MSKPAGRKSFLETLATFIVDKRNLIFFVYLAAAVFSLFSTFWVDVNSDLISYLPKNTETRQGIALRNESYFRHMAEVYGDHCMIMVAKLNFDHEEARLKQDLAGRPAGLEVELRLGLLCRQLDDIHLIQLLLAGHGHVTGSHTGFVTGYEVF